MLRAARLYYENYLTQQQIADELGLSRPAVSRLLAQARQEGIVQITIVDPFAKHESLETRIMQAFGLRRAVLVDGEGLTGELLRRRLGFATAEYLQNVLAEGNQVGIGWGRTLHAVVEALDVRHCLNIQVIPLIGGLGQISSSFQVNDLARRMAEAFGGTWQPFYAPAFVADPSALEALLRLPDVQSVIAAWSRVEVALVGIGHFASQRQSSTLFASYIAPDVLRKLEQYRAVGDICGRFFDLSGQQCIVERGILGISLEQLKALPHVIGVAGGPEKVAAILGALHGRYVHVLVTDTLTAKALLEKEQV